MLRELRKSNVGGDEFFRFQATQKVKRAKNWVGEVHGAYAFGKPWTSRTGADTYQRLHRYCVKYLRSGLILTEQEGKYILFVQKSKVFEIVYSLNFRSTAKQMENNLQHAVPQIFCHFHLSCKFFDSLVRIHMYLSLQMIKTYL